MTEPVPRVSYIVASYCHGRYVAQAVDSLLAQTGMAVEVIVVDDASPDDSRRVLAHYAADPHVRLVFHERNQGADRSRNEGLALARGEFVGVMDSDDFCLSPDAARRQVAVFDAHPSVGVVYTAFVTVDEGGGPLDVARRWEADYVRGGREEFARLILECYVLNSGTLVRRRCHEEVGGYDPSLPYASDWDRWLRLVARCDVGYLAQPLYAWRLHGRNATHATIPPWQTNRENLAAVRNAFRALPPEAPPALRRLALITTLGHPRYKRVAAAQRRTSA